MCLTVPLGIARKRESARTWRVAMMASTITLSVVVQDSANHRQTKDNTHNTHNTHCASHTVTLLLLLITHSLVVGELIRRRGDDSNSRHCMNSSEWTLRLLLPPILLLAMGAHNEEAEGTQLSLWETPQSLPLRPTVSKSSLLTL